MAIGFVAPFKDRHPETGESQEPGHGFTAHATAPAMNEKFTGFRQSMALPDKILQFRPYNFQAFEQSLVLACSGIGCTDNSPFLIIEQRHADRSGNMPLEEFSRS